MAQAGGWTEVNEIFAAEVRPQISDDAAGLTNEICTLLADPKARARLGANARVFAKATYDLRTLCLPRQLVWVESLRGPIIHTSC